MCVSVVLLPPVLLPLLAGGKHASEAYTFDFSLWAVLSDRIRGHDNAALLVYRIVGYVFSFTLWKFNRHWSFICCLGVSDLLLCII